MRGAALCFVAQAGERQSDCQNMRRTVHTNPPKMHHAAAAHAGVPHCATFLTDSQGLKCICGSVGHVGHCTSRIGMKILDALLPAFSFLAALFAFAA